MYDFNLAAKSEAYRAAEQRRYRAACLVRCLESSLDRINPEDFERVMLQLEAAQAELHTAVQEVIKLNVFGNEGRP
jgi:hypothetical protein